MSAPSIACQLRNRHDSVSTHEEHSLTSRAAASHQVVLARRCRAAPLSEAPSERVRVRVRVSVPLMLSPLLLIDAVCRICGHTSERCQGLHIATG